MRVTFKSTDADFAEISDTLKANLLDRLDNAGNVGDPEPYAFLSSPACKQILAEDSYPQDFTILGFAFKKTADPAGQYPLRRIQACTEDGACISAGCDLSGSDLADQSSLDFGTVARISKITSYYCQTKSLSSEEVTRYGRRLAAFVITYTPVLQGAPETSMLFAAPGSLFQVAAGKVTQQKPLLDCIAADVEQYNRQNQTYQIFSQVNDDGLNMLVTTNSGQVRRAIVNLAYNQFTGKSRTYINNVSILTALPNTTQVQNLFQGLEEIDFDIPFVENPLDFDTELTLERSITDTIGNVTIYQRSSMHSFKIPSIKIASVLDLGGVYSYSEGEQFTEQKQKSRADGLKNTIKLTVKADAYVIRGYPARQQYVAGTVVGLIYDVGGDPKFEISIPTGTPCLNADTPRALAKQILAFI